MKIILIIALLGLTACGTDQGALSGVPRLRTEKFISAEAAAGPYTIPGRTFRTLEQVNAFANAVPYHKEAGDNWKTPADFFAQGGDCEDFALAKYWMLQGYDIAKADDMDLLLVTDKMKGVPHMVLVVEGRVLDNQSPDVLPLDRVLWRYAPIVIVNHGGIF